MSIRHILILVVFHFLGINTWAQIEIWSNDLAENANEIIIYDDAVFTIIDSSKSAFSRKYKVAILNEFAEHGRVVDLPYGKFSTIKEASVVITNVLGKKIKTYSLKDLEDWKDDFSSIATDSRSKYLKVVANTYPYFVEVEYMEKNEGSLHYPTWIPIQVKNQSLKKASFTIVTPQKDRFRYKGSNVGEPLLTISEDKKHYEYKWEVSDIKAMEYESLASFYKNRLPKLYTAANGFVMENYSGSMETWKGFGQWINLLNENKNNLSTKELDEITKIANQYPDKIDKAKAIYSYLQNQFKYVSIQLGIGGWQPFETQYVNEKKYGDCKALSFYTKSLLNHVGIDAYYTLIKAGDYARDMDVDFPSSSFNHAIVAVPIEDDLIFLECTSQTDPFGYLGSFTSDRNALMITENGGEVVRTTAYSEKDNLQITKVVLELTADGNANGNVEREYRCIETSNDNFNYVLKEPIEEQKKWLYDNLDWGTFNINQFETYPVSNELLPKAGFALDLSFKNVSKKTGDRLFFRPFVFTNIEYYDLPKQERDQPIEIRYPYTQIDTISIAFPSGFSVERMLKNAELITPYGQYIRAVVQNENGLTFIRKFIILKGSYPNSEYESFSNFINQIQSFDKQRIVLKRED